MLFWIVPSLIILILFLPPFISHFHYWGYRLDLLLLVVLLVILVVIIDYKLTKFERITITRHETKRVYLVNKYRKLNTILFACIPVVFVIALLNTFSVSWLVSKIDDDKDLSMSAIEVGEILFAPGKDLDSNAMSISYRYLEHSATEIVFESQGTTAPIELTINGKQYSRDTVSIRRSNGSIWEEKYLLQQFTYYLLPQDLEDENVIVVSCDGLQKTYFLNKEYPVIDDKYKMANTLLEDGEINLRGHRFGDSVEQVVKTEGGEPSRVGTDELNANASTLIYDNLSFFGYESDIRYTFEDNELYKVALSAKAFLRSDGRRTDMKNLEVIRRLDVLGEPYFKEEIPLMLGYVTRWQTEAYHVFLFVHPTGFTFLVEAQDGR